MMSEKCSNCEAVEDKDGWIVIRKCTECGAITCDSCGNFCAHHLEWHCWLCDVREEDDSNRREQSSSNS